MSETVNQSVGDYRRIMAGGTTWGNACHIQTQRHNILDAVSSTQQASPGREVIQLLEGKTWGHLDLRASTDSDIHYSAFLSIAASSWMMLAVWSNSRDLPWFLSERHAVAIRPVLLVSSRLYSVVDC